MHLVCDFDETLFDTNRLWLEWLGILVDRGVDREAAIKQMEILNVSGWTHRAHALACGIDETDVDNLVQNFLQHAQSIGSSLVYKDVIPFFQKYKPPHSFSVLTYGNPDYQHSKILSTGLQDYFDAIRIAGPDNLKVAILKEMLNQLKGKSDVSGSGSGVGAGLVPALPYEPIAFVDDSPNELNPIVDAGFPIKLYRIIRPGARHDYWHERDDVAWKRIEEIGEIDLQ